MAGEEFLMFATIFPVVGAAFGIMGYWYWQNFFIPHRWPHRVLIFRKEGKNAYLYDEDRAFRMVNKKTKEHAYKLRRRKDRVPPFDFEILMIDKRGKEVLGLTEMQKGQYFPTQFHNPEGLVVEDKGTTSWLYDEIIRNETQYGKKPGFIEQYLPFIMIGMTAAILIVITVLTYQNSGAIAASNAATGNSLAVASTQIADGMKTLADALNQINAGTKPPI